LGGFGRQCLRKELRQFIYGLKRSGEAGRVHDEGSIPPAQVNRSSALIAFLNRAYRPCHAALQSARVACRIGLPSATLRYECGLPAGAGGAARGRQSSGTSRIGRS
jgi:hypothetical protein